MAGLFLWVLLTPSVVLAQHTAIWRGAPLSVALSRLASEGMDLAFDPQLVMGKQAFCVAVDVPAEEALRCILQGTGLDYYRRSSGTYVLAPATETPPQFGTLSGLVTDAQTGQPLPFAHVILSEPTLGRATNDAGRFTFDRLLPGTYHVTASYLGYQSRTTRITVPPGGSRMMEVALASHPVLVSPDIVVSGLAGDARAEALNVEALDDLPNTSFSTPLGAGVLAPLAALSGVRINDATADVHVQGGDPGEHQFRLDGAPVFLPFNVVSFIGPLSPLALGSLTLHKAGFEATVGSQIAGVIEAQHALGGGQRVHAYLDPLSANMRWNQQFGPDQKTRVMAAGRLGLWNQMAQPALRDLLNRWNTIDPFLLSAFSTSNAQFFDFSLTPIADPGLGFQDLHLAAHHQLDPLRSLSGSAYIGQTRLGSDLAGPPQTNTTDAAATDTPTYSDRYRWDTQAGQVRYEAVLSPRLLGSFRVRGSHYRLNHDFIAPDSITVSSEEDDGNRVFEWAVEGHLDYIPAPKHEVRLSASSIVSGSRFLVSGAQRPISHESTGWRFAVALQDEIALQPRLHLTAGTRLTYLYSRDVVYAEPRLSLRYDGPASSYGQWSFLLAGGVYRQFVNQFDLSSRGPRLLASSTRFWLAADASIAPPKAYHLAAEVLYRPTPLWSFHADAYYKAHPHILVVDYVPQPEASGGTLQQRAFLKASNGYGLGGSVRIKRVIGSGRAEIRYHYSDARRRISDLFDGALHRVPWDEPHRLEGFLDLQPLPRLTVLGRWRSVMGRSWGFRQAYYDFLGAHLQGDQNLIAALAAAGVATEAIFRIARQVDAYSLTQPNLHTLPPLHQLDLGVAYQWPIMSSTLQVRLDVLNVLGRNNIAKWFLSQQDPVAFASTGLLDRTDRLLLPRVFSFAVKWRW